MDAAAGVVARNDCGHGQPASAEELRSTSTTMQPANGVAASTDDISAPVVRSAAYGEQARSRLTSVLVPWTLTADHLMDLRHAERRPNEAAMSSTDMGLMDSQTSHGRPRQTWQSSL